MFLDKNLSVLAKRYPEYIDIIRNAPDSGKYTVIRASDGMINILDKDSGTSFYNNLSPQIHAENSIAQRNIKVPDLAVFLGSGFFYEIIAYINKYKPSAAVVAECEPELLKIAFTYLNLENLIKYNGFHLCIPSNDLQVRLFNILNEKNNKFFIKSINVIEFPLTFRRNKDCYMYALESLKISVLNTLSRYGNDPEDSLIGIKNTFYNINTIISSPGIKDLKGVFKGKPGIVVSAGPSLNKNMHLLEGLYDKAVIVGADTVLPVLQKKGFKPHMVTSLERISEVAELYRNQTEESLKDIYLSACPVVPKEVYHVYKGEKIIVYRDFATFKWIDIEKGIIDIGPSAGNMAFNVLEYLGCDPIILIGQDLAYDGKITHVSGTVFGDIQEKNIGRINIEGSVEPFVETNAVWKMFKDFYDVAVSKTKSRVIDATEGGAKILGTQIMPFSEAISTYIQKSFNPVDIIKKKLNKPFPSARISEIKKLVKKVEKAIELSESLSNSYREVTEEASLFLNSKPTEASGDDGFDLIVKMNMLENSFVEEDFYLIFMHYLQSYLIMSMVEINEIKSNYDNSKESSRMLISRYAQMYQVLSQLINVMKKELENLLINLKNEL